MPSPKIIAMFNHKGGVSKTTSSYNLGWALAERGHRTILVDADPQCNLTGIAMNLTFSQNSEVEEQAKDDANIDSANKAIREFWDETSDDNIFSALKPAFYSLPQLIQGVDCRPIKKNPNLFLLPGSLNLGEYETDLAVAQRLSDSLQSSRNLPGAFYELLRKTAEKMDAEYLIVDMSPSLGAINQNLVGISDLVLIPTAPDYYSIMALQSLSKKLNEWSEWARQLAQRPSLTEAVYPFPAPRLKLAGVIIQRYQLRKRATAEDPAGTPTQGFAKWIQEVEIHVNDHFVPSLSAEMLFAEEDYRAAGFGETKVIAKFPEFNSLLPKSQQSDLPVFRLDEQALDQTGVVLEQTLEKSRSLGVLFEQLATRIENLSLTA